MSENHYARVAELYDYFVQTDYDVPFFVNEAKMAGGEVLELMAGTGRLTIPLLEAGITLTCVDYSAEMLAKLREKVGAQHLKAEILHMDIRNFQLQRLFKQIIIPFQAFPELTAEADQRLALERIHEHLADDGIFICTLHNPTVRAQFIDNQLRLAGEHQLTNGHQLMVWLLQRFGSNSELVDVLEFFEEYDEQGHMCAKHYSSLQFKLLQKEHFKNLLRESGFEVVNLYGDYHYSDFDTQTSPFMIWVLKRSR